jgi:cytochrome P450
LKARQAFTHALYFLAGHPEYTEPLREEIERVIEEEGWTKTSMAKMRKLDSFFRETQRLKGINASTCTTLPVNVSTLLTFYQWRCREWPLKTLLSPMAR